MKFEVRHSLFRLVIFNHLFINRIILYGNVVEIALIHLAHLDAEVNKAKDVESQGEKATEF